MSHKLLFAALAICLFAACSGRQSASTQTQATGEYESTGEGADGIQRMHEYNYTDTLVTEGHKYIYTIHREASDSLPVVTDDDGTRYADNIYTITISSDGHEFFHRSFTKAAFASRLSDDFRKRGLLDGMMLDSSLPGLAFAVSVSMPQSDMVEPLLMRVDHQGGIAIERDERSDADLDDTDDEGV